MTKRARVIAALLAMAAIITFIVVRLSTTSIADPLIAAACEGIADRCESLVKSGIPVDANDRGKNTALTWAVFYCKAGVVKKLLEMGADVNHANERGFTPLMYTATSLRGHNLRGSEAERNEIAALLISNGADVNHGMGDGRIQGSGQTVLHFAAARKNTDLVRLLFSAGANRNLKSNDGYTPLDIAKFPDYAPNYGVIHLLENPHLEAAGGIVTPKAGGIVTRVPCLTFASIPFNEVFTDRSKSSVFQGYLQRSAVSCLCHKRSFDPITRSCAKH